MSEPEGDAPLLALDDVEVHFEDSSSLSEWVPEGVRERFGLFDSSPVRAVDGVSLEMEENDVLALVGESGSGKTTLGKTMVGLQRPTGGAVEFRGHDLWEIRNQTADTDIRPEDVQRSLQIIHQDPGSSLNPYRKVGANLSEPLKRWKPDLNRADRRERIVTLLNRTGVSPAEEYIERYPHQLSGGEKQRVALVRTLLMEPDLVLADEAVSALDSSLRVEIMDLMLELQKEFDTSFVFVSHNLSDARYFAKSAGAQVGVMYFGQLVELGPTEEVIQNPQHPYTKLLRWASAELDTEAAEESLHEEIPVRDLDVPDHENLPSGCRYHPRCPYAREVCTTERPDLYAAGGDRESACFRKADEHEYWAQSPIDEDAARHFDDVSVAGEAD
jgi:peptide/nickel transport system ATP-binding protein